MRQFIGRGATRFEKRLSRFITAGVVAILLHCGETLAGFDVTSWKLTTHLSQQSGNDTIIDSDDILTLSNPLYQPAHAHIGQNFADAAYDYSWLPAWSTGTFNTSLSHAIRSSNVETVSRGLVYILPTEDIRVTIDALLNYSHTPGDETGVRFGVSIRDENTHQFLFQQIPLGGNGNFQPSFGTLSVTGEQILTANVPYRLSYTIDSDNLADASHPPTGIFDATGYVHFTIAPVIPEPATLSLLALALPIIARRRRGRRFQPHHIPGSKRAKAECQKVVRS